MGDMIFEPGDIAFHSGSWEPVTILGHAYIHDGSGGSISGYSVMMRGWSEPQTQDQRAFVTYQENVERMTDQFHSRLDDLHRIAMAVTTSKQALERLLDWGEKNQQVSG